jgi:hypothetical protein
MDPGQEKYLRERYRAREWYGRSQYAKRTIKGFAFSGSEIRYWKIQRIERDERSKPPAIHSLWLRSEAAAEILSVDVWEASSIKAAHDQLIEVLANMQAGAIERRTQTTAPGDVAFGLDVDFGLKDTMVLFARVNLVVLTRNAGPKVVSVGAIAAGIDAVFIKRLEADSRKRG